MGFLDDLHGEGLKTLIRTGGYVVLFCIIFAETGLLLGFFLPGDSLLFVAGYLASQPKTGLNITLLIIILCVAAITGNLTGYFLGTKIGENLLQRPDSRFFKRRYVEQTQAFYDKHGPKTIVLARFVPIVRTFATTVAGVGKMDFKVFTIYSVVGGIFWVVSMCLLGYFLGQHITPDNLDKVVIGVVLLSLAPMFLHYIAKRFGKKQLSP